MGAKEREDSFLSSPLNLRKLEETASNNSMHINGFLQNEKGV
jgi:hypothetical protein